MATAADTLRGDFGWPAGFAGARCTADGFFAAADFGASGIARGFAAIDAVDTLRFGIAALPAVGFLRADDAATVFLLTFFATGFFAAGFFVTVLAAGFFAEGFFTAAFATDFLTAFFAAGLRDAAADFPAATPAFLAATTFFVAVAFFVAGDFVVAADFEAAADVRAVGLLNAAAFFFTGALVLRDGPGLMSYLQFAGMRESIRSLCPRSAVPV